MCITFGDKQNSSLCNFCLFGTLSLIITHYCSMSVFFCSGSDDRNAQRPLTSAIHHRNRNDQMYTTI